MDLFNTSASTQLLPFDGQVIDHGQILSIKTANYYFQNLLTGIAWKNEEAIMFGKHIITKRKAAWYGAAGFAYNYAGITHISLAWTDDLLFLKDKVQNATGCTYNSCLLNLYHNGLEGMGWHSDDEDVLVKNSSIASLSLGAPRKFAFKHKKTKVTISTVLAPGSLLEMKGTTQTHWLHALPKTTKVHTPRINLTFRQHGFGLM